MPRIFNCHSLNRLVFSTLLTTFSLTYAIPVQAYIQQETYQVGVNDVAAMIRLKKLVEKLVKSKEKRTDKILGYLSDVRDEIENSYQVKFNLDQCMNSLTQELAKTEKKVSKNELELIKKKLTKKDKKKKSYSWYVANTMNLDNYDFNEFNEETFYPIMKGSKKDKDKDEEEVTIPALLMYGVSLTLCGIFLMVIPIPACREWGSKMVVAGVTACANSISNRVDENRKEEKNKK